MSDGPTTNYEPRGFVCTRHGGIAVHERGKGTPVVLLHGGMGSWTHWSRVAPALSERFRVCAVDLPGFGASDAPPADVEPDSYMKPVLDAVEGLTLSAEPVLLAGFSFGGAVAARLARDLESRCAGLALVGPAGFGRSPGRTMDMWTAPPPDDPGYRDVIRHNLAASMIAAPTAIDEPTLDLHIANVARTRFDSRTVSHRATLLTDLAAVQAPVLLAWGERDAFAWPTLDERIGQCRAAVPEATISIIPGAGHWAQHERADIVTPLLAGWFAGLGRNKLRNHKASESP